MKKLESHPMLSDLATMGAQVIDPNYEVNPACNLWFMIASTIVMTGVGWFVADVGVYSLTTAASILVDLCGFPENATLTTYQRPSLTALSNASGSSM